MDYALAHALQHKMDGIRRVITFYDVNCQYSKHLARRLSDNDFISLPSEIDIIPGIGAWHIHGHRQECLVRFGPSFISGAGRVDGEIMETLWSSLNVISPSARGMSAAHRQELLDYQMNDSNFLKMIRMSGLYVTCPGCTDFRNIGRSLQRKFQVTLKTLADSNATFDKLDAGVPVDEREKWLQGERDAITGRKTDPKAMDIFEIQMERGRCLPASRGTHSDLHPAPTVKVLELDLLAQQSGQQHRMHGSVSWIAEGLRIEEAQTALRLKVKQLGPQATEAMRLTVARKREGLECDISRFNADAVTFMGDAMDVDGDPSTYLEWSDDDSTTGNADDRPEADGQNNIHIIADDIGEHNSPIIGRLNAMVTFAEQVALPLPSVLGRERCISKGLSPLVDKEIQLRIGQANDALHELRLSLVDKALLFRTEVRHSKSQATTTRAWAKVTSVQNNVNRHARIYRRARRQLIALGAKPDIISRYQSLSPIDLKATSAVADPNSRGQRNSTLAWFWSMDIPRDTEVDNWMSECKLTVLMPAVS